MKSIRETLSKRFEHPLLASILLLSVGLLAFGGILDVVHIPGVPGVVSGFLGIYAIITAFLGIVGYLILFAVRSISMLRDRMAPHAA